jgi:hypothetical protein
MSSCNHKNPAGHVQKEALPKNIHLLCTMDIVQLCLSATGKVEATVPPECLPGLWYRTHSAARHALSFT